MTIHLGNGIVVGRHAMGILISGGRFDIPAPDGFDWSYPSEFKIYGGGGTYNVGSFDVAQYAPTGKTYYVDVTAGNDSTGAGTEAAPYKSLAKITTLSDYDVIYVKPGTYKRSSGGTDGASFTRSCAIKRWPGTVGDIIITVAQSGLSWSVNGTYSNVYEATRSAVSGVLDAAVLDGDGDYSWLVNAGSIANVDSTAGSWYTDGTKVYVRTSDSRAPDADVWPLVPNNMRFSGNTTVYLEDLTLVGGASGAGVVWHRNGGAGQTPKLYLKNCTVSHGVGNGIQADGIDVVISQNVTVKKCLQDGFNYQAYSTVISHAIEIGCTGQANGTADGNGNDNGSSMHGAGSIIRVNGDYYANIGPNVIDIDASESWNLGCGAHDSASDIGTKVGYQINGDMWLDGCTAADNADGDLSTAASSTIHVRNSTYSTTVGPGTVVAY